jgi:hypothetical protein
MPQPQLQSTEIGLQVIDEQLWSTGRGYESRIVRVLSWLDVDGGCGYVVCMQMKSTGETSPLWATPARMTRRVDVADWKDVWNVRQSIYDDTVFTRRGAKFRTVSF